MDKQMRDVLAIGGMSLSALFKSDAPMHVANAIDTVAVGGTVDTLKLATAVFPEIFQADSSGELARLISDKNAPVPVKISALRDALSKQDTQSDDDFDDGLVLTRCPFCSRVFIGDGYNVK